MKARYAVIQETGSWKFVDLKVGRCCAEIGAVVRAAADGCGDLAGKQGPVKLHALAAIHGDGRRRQRLQCSVAIHGVRDEVVKVGSRRWPRRAANRHSGRIRNGLHEVGNAGACIVHGNLLIAESSDIRVDGLWRASAARAGLRGRYTGNAREVRTHGKQGSAAIDAREIEAKQRRDGIFQQAMHTFNGVRPRSELLALAVEQDSSTGENGIAELNVADQRLRTARAAVADTE